MRSTVYVSDICNILTCNRRPQNAWTGSRTFSPAPARSPAPGAAAASNGFPPLGGAGANGNNNNAAGADKTLGALTGLIGTTITLNTRTSQYYEGTVASTTGEGDTKGVTLRNVRDLNAAAGAAEKEHVFIAATNIAEYRSGPASSDSRQPNGSGNPDSFKTDTDISRIGQPRRERELQAWVGDGPGEALGSGPGGKSKDEQTFGAGASGGSWDQFAANESLFGVKPTFDEDAYTTKLDRSAADFKERERKAQVLANEIMNVRLSHIWFCSNTLNKRKCLVYHQQFPYRRGTRHEHDWHVWRRRGGPLRRRCPGAGRLRTPRCTQSRRFRCSGARLRAQG